MAKCKVCGSEFLGESEYCDNCLKENKDHSSESYLDSLLKSMVNQSSTNQHININKKANIKSNTTKEKLELENKDEQEDNNLDNRKNTSDEQEQIKDSIEDILALEEENQEILALEEEGYKNKVIKEEDDFNSGILSLHEDVNNDFNDESVDNILSLYNDFNEESNDNNFDDSKEYINEDTLSLNDNLEEEPSKDMKEDILSIHDNSDEESRKDMNDDIVSLHNDFNVDNNEDDSTLVIQDDYHKEDDNTSSTSDFGSMNQADDDLVALLGMITGLEESANESMKEDVFALEEKEEDWSQELLSDTSDDITKPSKSKDALNNIDTSLTQDDLDNNDYLNDILSIDNLFGGEPMQAEVDKNPDNLGEVFSDSLSAIQVLNDNNEEDTSLLSQSENREEAKKKKRAKIFGSSTKDEEEMEEVQEKPKKKEKVKKSKKNKKNKSKDKAVAANKDNSNQEEDLDNKKAVKGKKEKKIKDKKNAKVKKENAKKKNADKNPNSIVKDVMEEDDTGKISKAGTSLALIFCGLVAAIVIVGTNLYTYSLNISKAKTDFERQRYTDAYNNIYGYKVKPNDMELYDKIMTVMYVNKQLNSFYNYSNLNKQPEALDSLLKGLARYEEVLDTAVSLGIKEDMDSLKSQILVELESKYNIKEKGALAIIYTDDKEEYTQYILNAVAENTN